MKDWQLKYVKRLKDRGWECVSGEGWEEWSHPCLQWTWPIGSAVRLETEVDAGDQRAMFIMGLFVPATTEDLEVQ